MHAVLCAFAPMSFHAKVSLYALSDLLLNALVGVAIAGLCRY